MSTQASWQPRDAAPAFDRSAYSDRARRAAIAGWQALCDEERDSVTITGLVLAELSLLGAPPPILGAAARVLEDEVRHVQVCTLVIERLGGQAGARALRPREGIPGEGSRTERLAGALCAGYVAGEAVSAACFAAARSLATEPLVRWAYTELLRDEIRHSGFGAEAAGWLMRDFSPSSRQALWPSCVRELENFEARAGGNDVAPADAAITTECQRLGMVPRAVVQGALLKAIPRWILPRLRRLGVIAQDPPQ